MLIMWPMAAGSDWDTTSCKIVTMTPTQVSRMSFLVPAPAVCQPCMSGPYEESGHSLLTARVIWVICPLPATRLVR